MNIEQLRSVYPGYTDDEIASAIQSVHYPDAALPEVKTALGIKPPTFMQGVKRGAGEAFQQIPQLGYGLLAGAGAAGESAAGEGGIFTGIKKAGVEGYQRWGETIAKGAQPTDDADVAWERAKGGDFGALADWFAHGLGYVGAQGVQALATAGIGGAIGKMTARGAAEAVAGGMVRKEAVRLAEQEAGKDAAAAAIAQAAMRPEVIAQATSNTAARLGQLAGLGVQAFGMEGGEIFGDLAKRSVEEGRALSGAELAKAFLATAAAGGLEFVGDKIGLDIAMGKSKLFKLAESAQGKTGRAVRAGMGAAAATPIEAGTEYLQTGLEEFGKGTEASPLPWQQSDENQRQAANAAWLGGLGGAVIGAGGGALKRPVSLDAAAEEQRRKERADAALAEIVRAPDVETAVAATIAATDIPLPKPSANPRAANAALIGEIRQLDQQDQKRALDLYAITRNPRSPDHIRRGAQNELDALLLPVRQVPVAEAAEIQPETVVPAQSPLRERIDAMRARTAAAAAPETIPVGTVQAESTEIPMSEAAALAARPVAEPRRIPAGHATELAAETVEPAQPIASAPAPERAPRTVRQDADAERDDAVKRVIEGLRRINTPLAQSYVRDFDAGRITPQQVLDFVKWKPTQPAEVERRLEYAAAQGRAAETPQAMIEAAAAQAPQADQGLLLTGDGQPYGTKAGAAARATREGGGSIIEVPGGWAVRPKGAQDATAAGQAAAGTAGAGVGRGAELGRGAGNMGAAQEPQRVGGDAAASARGNEPAGTVEAPGRPDVALKPPPKGFTDGMSATRAKAVNKALDHEAGGAFGTKTKRQVVQELVAAGATLRRDKAGARTLRAGRRVALDEKAAGRMAMDYAEHLIQRRAERPAEGASNAPQEVSQQQGPAGEHPPGDRGGQADHAGGGDRVQRAEAGAEQGRQAQVAPGRRARGARTVMGSKLLALVNNAGGLHPSLLSEFSVRFETGRFGKDGRPIVQWRNPMTPQGKLFRASGTSDYSEIARLLEEDGYIEPGSVDQDYKEAGERAKGLILAALNRENVQSLEERQAEEQAAQDAEREAHYAQVDAEAAADMEAEREAIIAANNLGIEALADEDIELAATEDTASAMRAMGFDEQEIADAVAREEAKRRAAPSPARADADADQGTPAPVPNRGAAPRPGAEEGLSSPSESDLREQARRRSAAEEADRREQKRLDDKARADAALGEFTLTGSNRPADVAAAAGQGDIFAQPEAPTVDPFTGDYDSLVGKTIEQTITLEDGRKATMRVDAAVAMRDIDKRIQTLRELRACHGRAG